MYARLKIKILPRQYYEEHTQHMNHESINDMI